MKKNNLFHSNYFIRFFIFCFINCGKLEYMIMYLYYIYNIVYNKIIYKIIININKSTCTYTICIKQVKAFIIYICVCIYV